MDYEMNSTKSSSEENPHQNERILISMLTPDLVILFIYLIFGLTGNVLVVYFYKCKIREKKDKENRYFIVYLASLDIAVCSLGSLFGIILDLKPLTFHSDWVCKSIWLLTKVFVFSSGFLLVVISVHRFRLICKPLHMQMTLYWKRVSIGVSVVCGAIVATPCVFLYGQVSIYDKNETLILTTCGKLKHVKVSWQLFYDVFMIVIGLCGGTVVIVLYSLVGQTLYRQHKFRNQNATVSYSVKPKLLGSTTSLGSSSQNITKSPVERVQNSETRNGTDSKSGSLNSLLSITTIHMGKDLDGFWHKKENVRFSLMFLLISVIYMLAYLPRMYIMVRESCDDMFWDSLTTTEFQIHVFLYRLYILNNVTNPIVYGMFDVRLKQEIKKCFCKCRRRKYKVTGKRS